MVIEPTPLRGTRRCSEKGSKKATDADARRSTSGVLREINPTGCECRRRRSAARQPRFEGSRRRLRRPRQPGRPSSMGSGCRLRGRGAKPSTTFLRALRSAVSFRLSPNEWASRRVLNRGLAAARRHPPKPGQFHRRYRRDSFAIGRNRVGVGPQVVALGSNGMRLTAFQTRNIEPRGVTGFVSFHQQVFGVGEDCPSGWNHVARRKCLLLSHASGKQHEVGGTMFCRKTRAHLPSGENALAEPSPKRTAEVPVVSRVNTA